MWFHTGGRDYESGPYSVTIKRGETSAVFCIEIYNDSMFEMNEEFTMSINNNTLHTDIVLMQPYTATITIVDDECKIFTLI